MLLNCGVGEDSWESLGLQEIQPVHPKGNWSWIYTGGLMLKLKLQYFGHLMWRADSLEKILMLGKIEGGGERDDRGWDGCMASLIWWTWVWASSGNWWWTGKPGVLQSMGLQIFDTTERLNWTDAACGILVLQVLTAWEFPNCFHRNKDENCKDTNNLNN